MSLRPKQYDTIAVVHRANAILSPAARLMVDLATERIQALTDPSVAAHADLEAPIGAGPK